MKQFERRALSVSIVMLHFSDRKHVRRILKRPLSEKSRDSPENEFNLDLSSIKISQIFSSFIKVIFCHLTTPTQQHQKKWFKSITEIVVNKKATKSYFVELPKFSVEQLYG